MREHPARRLQIALVIEEVTQQVELLVCALARNFCEDIAGMTANSLIAHLHKSRRPDISSSPPCASCSFTSRMSPGRHPGGGAQWRRVEQTLHLICNLKAHGAQAGARIFKREAHA